jgi:2-phosphosulfolactate phosphatase
MRKSIAIDCFPENVRAYRHGYAIVAVDVIRATTSAITIAALGGRCFPAASIDDARRLAADLNDPLLSGELDGQLAPGFEINNSPAELAMRTTPGRPVILLSSSGTKLIREASVCDVVYLACFRNYDYTACYLAGRYARVAVIGAGSRGEFREEDQMCCAWIARDLIAEGYMPENNRTIDLVDRWTGEGLEAALRGKSANYLRRSGQIKDLEFVFTHIRDLSATFVMNDGEVITVRVEGTEPFAVESRITNTASEAPTEW